MSAIDNNGQNATPAEALAMQDAAARLIEEGLISLKEAAGLYPKRGGKETHFATVFRHAMNGHRGIKLESTRAGGTLCTSRQAVARFFGQLASQDALPEQPPKTPAARQKEIDRAMKELERRGI